MRIRYLPRPYRPERKGGNFFSTIGRHSRPLIKRFLRSGKNVIIKRLRGKAVDQINRGGNALTSLVTKQGGGAKKKTYKSLKRTKLVIPHVNQLKKRKKLQGGKKVIKGGKKGGKKGGRKRKKKKKNVKIGGKKKKKNVKIGGKKKKNGGKKKIGRKIIRKKKGKIGGKKNKKTSVFDFL